MIGDSSEPTVRRIFEVTGLFPVFPVFASREEAVSAARANAANGDLSDVWLRVPARPENVASPDRRWPGCARRSHDAKVLADVKLAVTEACTNSSSTRTRTGWADPRRLFEVEATPGATSSSSSCATTAAASRRTPRARASGSGCR